jgi:hypothetical protein
MLDPIDIVAEPCKVTAGIESWVFGELLAALEGEKLCARKILQESMLVCMCYAERMMDVLGHTIKHLHFSSPLMPPLPSPVPSFHSQPYPHHQHQEPQAMHHLAG